MFYMLRHVNYNTCCMIIDVLYVEISACSITIHSCFAKISIFVVLFLSFSVVPTKNYVASRFVSGSTFSVSPYGEKANPKMRKKYKK